MSYFDEYKKRIQAYGNSNQDAYKNSTASVINGRFSESPFFKVATVAGVNTDIRFLQGKDFREKTILFRPYTTIAIGATIMVDGVNWMVFDFEKSDLFPKASVKICNEYMKWKDRVAATHILTVVASASRYIKYNIAKDSFDVELLQGGIYIYAARNAESASIKSSMRFIFGYSTYEISGIDDLTYVDGAGVGMIQFTTRLTTAKASDDFTARIADNSAVYMHDGGTLSGGASLW